MNMRRRYDKQGILALYPQAFWDLFVEVTDPVNQTAGDCEIVEIRGPLEHHDDWWCDSYESILERVTAACEGSARNIILKIDSPGGELLGCFDAAHTIRARCKKAGKRLIAYVDGCACSAGYALACAAERIVTSETAFCGSIGVLITRLDVTAQDAQRGMTFAMVASGKRKLDGNPHTSLTQAELTAMQEQCDSLASLFFELVASLRGIDAAKVAALEAGVFHGAAAVEVGLADRVQTFDELLASLASGEGDTMAGENEEETTPEASKEDIDEARSALERAAEGDGDEAERARKALEILNGESSEDDDESEDESETSARSSSPRPTGKQGQSVAASSAVDLAQTVQTLSQEMAAMKAENEAIKRQALLDSRPDLTKQLVKTLSAMSYADAKKIVDGIPKPTTPKPAATTTVPATRGQGQEGGANGAPAPDEHTALLDRAFSRDAKAAGVKRTGTRLEFGLGPAPESKPKSLEPAAGEGEPKKGTAA